VINYSTESTVNSKKQPEAANLFTPDISADVKGLIDFTNNCKLWTSNITNPNYNMLSNNLQQCLNFPGLIYNNYVNDNSYHYNTFNFNIFPLSILGNYEQTTGVGVNGNNVNNSINNNNVYENLMNMYNRKKEKKNIENKPREVFKPEETQNNPFSLNFNFDDYSGVQTGQNEEKEFNNIDFNEKNNFYL
jgi:hypothetical protein